jgi:hypothetical protein
MVGFARAAKKTRRGGTVSLICEGYGSTNTHRVERSPFPEKFLRRFGTPFFKKGFQEVDK